MTIKALVALLGLSLSLLSTACGEEKPVEHAVEDADQTADTANARSPAAEAPEPGLEAVDRAVGEAADTLEEETRGLAEAAKKGAASRAATGVEQAAREAADTVETPGGVEAAADELSKNVEKSTRVYDETYDAARQHGENPIEAGGDAYNDVLDIPAEKDKESP